MKVKFVSGPFHLVEERVNKMLEEGWNIGEHGWFSQDLLRAAMMMVKTEPLDFEAVQTIFKALQDLGEEHPPSESSTVDEN